MNLLTYVHAMNAKRSLLNTKLIAGNQIFNRFHFHFSKSLSFVLFAVGLFCASLTFAQVGPAGVNANIQLWLDASDLDGDGIIEDMAESGLNPADSSITEWRDKSGVLTGTHFVPPAASALFTDVPHYAPYDPNFGGLTAVDFNANSALYHDLASTWSGPHTVFIVFKQKTASVPLGTSVFSSGIDTTGAATYDDHFQVGADTAGTSFSYYATANSATTATSTENVFGLQSAAGSIIYYTATRSAGNSVSTRVNGGAATSVTFPAGGNVFDQYILNANRDTSLLNNCYIAEVIVYNAQLSGEALNRIHAYLDCKYITPFAGAAPGGIDPCSISLWLKADPDPTITNISAGNVDDWYDQGPYGFDGAETGGSRPSHVASDNNFNPSINFDDGANERLDFGSSPSPGTFDALTMGTNAFSIYSVAKADAGLNGALFSDNLCLESSGYRIRYDQAADEWVFDGVVIETTTFSQLNSVSVATANTSTPYSLISFKRNQTVHTIQTNEGDVATSTVSPTLPFSATNSATERWVGRRNNNGSCSNDHYDGNISEIIVVRSTVSANEDKKIQSYLGLKYGLTLPSTLGNYLASDGITDLWTFSTHWFDVAGLGEDSGSTLDQRVGKSQHPSAIVTMSTNTDFTAVNDGARPPVGDGNYIVWGNNNIPASSAWTLSGAPTDYAILPLKWRVKKTGAMGAVQLQVDVNDADNNMPTFFGDLYLLHGPDLSTATPVLLTETSAGIWSTTTAVNFSDSAYFTFAVKNDLKVEFSASTSATVDESVMGPFTDVLIDGVINVPSTFSVNVTGGGTATNGGGTPDYNYTDQTYNLIVGSYDVDTITLTLPTLAQDLVDEGLETAIFTLVLGTGVNYGDVNGTLGAVQTHTMTITDDDSYQIAIGNPTNGAEPSTAATFEIFMVGVATNTSGAPITGTISYAGTASVSDYTPQAAFTIGIGAASTTVNLPVTDDSNLEGTESIIATITAVGAVPSTPTDTTYITDDEEAGLQISIGSPVDANEGSGSVSFQVSLSSTNQTGGPITGDVTYLTGTALDGTDFSGTGTFTIANGASIGPVTSSTTADNLVENTESVIAIISNPSIGVVHPTNFTDTAYIFDEDTTGLEISILAPVTTVVEGTGVTFDYDISLDAGKINGTGADITGTLTLTGTATSPPATDADYTNSTPIGFAIPDGSNSTTVTITVANDTLIEPGETVIGTISGLSIGVPNSTNYEDTVTILDDDAGGIFISIGSPTDTTEAPPSGGPFVSYNIFIEGGGLNTTGAPITGNISYSGTALPGVDFTVVPTFSIPVGANSVTIQVPVLDNFVTEPTETVTATLATGTGSPSTGSFANLSATALIHDDDASSLGISIGSPVDGEEGVGNVEFTVSLDGGAVNGTGSPIFGSITFGGAAVSADFDLSGGPLPTTFSIPNGSTSTTIVLSVFDDSFVEYTETVIGIIGSPSVGSITTDSSTANIIDNDLGALLISIDTPVDGAEGVNDGSFLISMGGGLANGLGVPLTGDIIFSGSATPAFDFANVNSFAIPDGASSVTHDIPVIDDVDIEPQFDTLIATLANPLIPGTINSSADTDTLLIEDNDLAGATLQIAATLNGVEAPFPDSINPLFAVSFEGGLQNFTGAPITGDITLSGTATAGLDYQNAATFTIPDSSGVGIIELLVINDALEEPTETITVTLTTTSLGTIGSTDNATADLADDDTDSDNDGLINLFDPITGNIDSDCDGIFDGCDADADGDGFLDAGMVDTDGDGVNDLCDAYNDLTGTLDNGPDSNGDGLNDVFWDPTDNDQDLLTAQVDPDDDNPDFDGDEIPDGADADVDGDGILDNGCDDDLDGVHNVADGDTPGNVDLNGNGIDDDWDVGIEDTNMINYIVSPNGDNINDHLEIKGLPFVRSYDLRIFNRWGTMIYESRNYQNDWDGEASAQGAGTLNGEKVPDGTYFYVLDVIKNDDETILVRGYIDLRR